MVRTFIKYYKEGVHPRGCVVAVVDTEWQNFNTGWSMYNKNHETKPFTKKMARTIALGRANYGLYRNNGSMPAKLNDTRDTLIEICRRWIKKNENGI
jgi:hypothetical protein